VPGGGGAGGETVGYELFVFKDEALQKTFLRCRSVQGFDVELAQAFDVYRSSVLDGER
jgi:hypothetical protein